MHINIRWNLRFFHMVYTRQARAIAKRLVEAVQSVRGATRHDFHDAVGEVTDPASAQRAAAQPSILPLLGDPDRLAAVRGSPPGAVNVDHSPHEQ